MPVYNAESTVCRMLDSIISQTFRDWELIVIDDGSVDNSAKILDSYSDKDERIRVIHRQNDGVSSARQMGLELSRGEYTIHADADDWVDPDMLEDMLRVANVEDADIVIADFFTDANRKSTLTRQRPSSLTSCDILYGLYAKDLFGGLCHKLIRKSVYDKACARFYHGIDYCEDLLILTQILTRSNPKIAYLPKAYYHYVLNDNSITQAVSAKGLRSMKLFHQEALKLLPKEDKYITITDSFAKNEFTVYFMNRLYASKKELRDEYRRLRTILLQTSGLRWKLGYYCINMGLLSLAHRLIKF